MFYNNCNQDFQDESQPKWEDHNYAAITFSDGAWYGYYKVNKGDKEPWYHEGWKGTVLTLPSDRGDFIKYGTWEGDERYSY